MKIKTILFLLIGIFCFIQTGSALSCKTGWVDSGLGCEWCKSGTYANTEENRCVPCPAGSFSDGYGSTECTKCPVGTYTDKTGQTECTKCQGVKTNYSEGSSQCDKYDYKKINFKAGSSSWTFFKNENIEVTNFLYPDQQQ